MGIKTRGRGNRKSAFNVFLLNLRISVNYFRCYFSILKFFDRMFLSLYTNINSVVGIGEGVLNILMELIKKKTSFQYA